MNRSQFIIVVCLIGFCSAQSAAQDAGAGEAVDQVWGILRTLEPGDDAEARSAQRLFKLGDAGLPAMASVLRGLRPHVEPSSDDRPLPPALPLTQRQRTVLIAAIRRHSDERIEQLIRSSVPAGADLEQRTRALQLVRDLAQGGLLDVAVEAAAGIEPRAMYSPHVAATYREAFAAILADPLALRRLEKRWADFPEPLVEPTLEAVADLGGPATLSFLTRRLGQDAKLNVFVLKQVDRIACVLPRPDRTALDRVRGRLRDGSVRERQEVLRTLAELHDSESFLTILRCLGDSEPRVRRLARWSLEKMTGERFAADSDRWWEWYEAERDWLSDGWPALQERLHSSKDAEILGALRKVGRRKLMRDAIVPDVEPLLLSRSPVVRESAAAVLRTLGSPYALPALVDALSDPEKRVRKAVLEALREITNKDGAADQEAWRRILGQA